MGRKRFPGQSVAMVEFRSRNQHLMANHLPKTFEPNNTNDKLEKRMIVYKRKNKSVVEAPMPIVSSNLAAEPQFPVTYSNPELSRQPKRAKICNGERSHLSVVDYSDPFALPQMLEALDEGRYGQVTKEIESLCARRMHILNDFYRTDPSLSSLRKNSIFQHSKSVSMLSPDIIDLEREDFANNAVSAAETCKEGTNNPLVINLDSDEDGNEDRVGTRLALVPTIEPGYLKGLPRFQIENNDNSKLWSPADGRNISVESNWKSSYMYEKVVLGNYKVKKSPKKLQGKVRKDRKGEKQEDKTVDCKDEKQDEKTLDSKDEKQDDKTLDSKDVKQQDKSLDGKNEKQEDRKTLDDGVPEKEDEDKELSSYIGLPDSVGMTDTRGQVNTEDDGLADIWREMTLALECSKEVASDGSAVQQKGEDECEHSCILKDDLGYVCQLCGVIQKRIETIFDYQWIKGTRSTKTYPYESRNKKDSDRPEINQFSGHEQDSVDEIAIHPRHMKQMKPHQVEGIKFLLRNLVAEKPGGCILAHAPGSGKTFMIISFIQSFLAKYPYAKPLVILPKGILGTWKKEFQRWQVEDIPLYDFYSSKADIRSQQLEVLNSWVAQKSVLFLGYKQFATIIHGIDSSHSTNQIEIACREMLLKAPSLLILDEGHTPRNENTDILLALAMVKTPRKVVLSGTLFQNHVREVFNILNLVRPKFLKLDTSRAIVKRVLSRVQISGGSRRNLDLDSSFFDLVEETLQRDDDFKRKITVIKDLREMTNNVLHYYKGDFLEELPGFVDFAVVLNLTEEQKSIIQKLPKMDKFKRSSVGSAIYMHPQLLEISQKATGEKGSSFVDDKIDQMVENLNVNDGVKTKFFLNILGLAESAGEKILVFSQYLLPLKFLERILVKVRGWRLGKEIFMISGDSSPEHREWSMEQFNNSQDGKVLFGSIKACGEGISLVGASRVLILDVHLNPSVTRQAIGRAYRPGQMKKVHTYRLVAADSPEEEDHSTSFRKELISKMWFEWNEFGGAQDFNMEEVDVKSCEDLFLESSFVNGDVKVLFKR